MDKREVVAWQGAGRARRGPGLRRGVCLLARCLLEGFISKTQRSW